MRWRLTSVVALSALVAGCDATSPPMEVADSGPVPGFVDVFEAAPDPASGPHLTPREHLIRLSLDLRGVRPTVAEYDQVDADPASLDAIVEDYLHDPRFADRVRDHWAQVLRTRVETFPVTAQALGLGAEEQPALFADIGEEALQILARIVAEDRPLTELLTADWTMATTRLQRAWPVMLTGEVGDAGWGTAVYTDGRPAAGLLSTNGMWWRYLSDGVNYGRGRANAVARIFLCGDFLDRPVDFPRDIDLTDEAGIRDAIATNDGCIGCHAGLDPLASYLAGFQYKETTAAEMAVYHPEREPAWRTMTGQTPAFYGAPGYALADLGQQIAADPRFVSCMVQTAFERFIGRLPHTSDPSELDAMTRHREAAIAGGLTLRAVVRSVLGDPRYTLAAPAAPPRVVSPEVWGDVLQDLTGFRLTTGGADLLATSATGLLTLAGGSDGRAGAAAASQPTPTMALVWARTAEAAALHAVQRDLSSEDPRALFVAVDPTYVPTGAASEDAAMQVQAAFLHRRLFGTHVDGASIEVTATLSLWDAMFRLERDARRAWAGTLAALLRDPAMVHY